MKISFTYKHDKREHLLIIAGLLAGIACVLTTGF